MELRHAMTSWNTLRQAKTRQVKTRWWAKMSYDIMRQANPILTKQRNTKTCQDMQRQVKLLWQTMLTSIGLIRQDETS